MDLDPTIQIIIILTLLAAMFIAGTIEGEDVTGTIVTALVFLVVLLLIYRTGQRRREKLYRTCSCSPELLQALTNKDYTAAGVLKLTILEAFKTQSCSKEDFIRKYRELTASGLVMVNFFLEDLDRYVIKLTKAGRKVCKEIPTTLKIATVMDNNSGALPKLLETLPKEVFVELLCSSIEAVREAAVKEMKRRSTDKSKELRRR